VPWKPLVSQLASERISDPAKWWWFILAFHLFLLWLYCQPLQVSYIIYVSISFCTNYISLVTPLCNKDKCHFWTQMPQLKNPWRWWFSIQTFRCQVQKSRRSWGTYISRGTLRENGPQLQDRGPLGEPNKLCCICTCICICICICICSRLQEINGLLSGRTYRP